MVHPRNNQQGFDDLQTVIQDAGHGCESRRTDLNPFVVENAGIRPFSVDDEIETLLTMFRPKPKPSQATVAGVETDVMYTALCSVVLPPPIRFKRRSKSGKPAIPGN